jgi:hypothetical protein
VPIVVESVSSGTVTSSANCVVDRPTGTADGDLLLAFPTNPRSETLTVPSGWTAEYNALGSFNQIFCFSKRASGEPTTWTWGTGAAVGWTWCCLRISGVNGSSVADAIEAKSQAEDSGFNTTWIAPTVTSLSANSLIVAVVMTGSTSNAVTGAPSGYTLHFGSSGTNHGLGVASVIRATAGATGALNFTATSNRSQGATFAIKESAAASGKAIPLFRNPIRIWRA